MYQKKFYNIMVLSVVVVFSMFVVLTGMGLSSSDAPKGPDSLDDDVVVDDDPSTDPIPDNTVVPGETATPFERIAFALKVMYEGAGYSAYTSQSTTIMGQTESIAQKGYGTGKYFLSEEWYEMTGMMSSLGKNEFNSSFCDGSIVKIKTINNRSNYDFKQKTYNQGACDKMDNYTMAEWNANKKMPFNKFFTTINADTARVTKYDKSKSNSYYSITVSLDVNKLDEPYFRVFTQNSDSIKLKSIIVEFQINKATGYMKLYNKVEAFSASYLGFSADCEVYSKTTFTSMNKSQMSYITPVALSSFGIAI